MKNLKFKKEKATICTLDKILGWSQQWRWDRLGMPTKF